MLLFCFYNHGYGLGNILKNERKIVIESPFSFFESVMEVLHVFSFLFTSASGIVSLFASMLLSVLNMSWQGGVTGKCRDIMPVISEGVGGCKMEKNKKTVTTGVITVMLFSTVSTFSKAHFDFLCKVPSCFL